MKFLATITGFTLLFACAENQEQHSNSENDKEVNVPNNLVQKNPDKITVESRDSVPKFPSNNSDISYAVFQNEDQTWGYELLANGKAIIRQSNIPSLPGTKGFSSKEKAEIVALHLQKKMVKGEFPGVDSLELVELKVLP